MVFVRVWIVCVYLVCACAHTCFGGSPRHFIPFLRFLFFFRLMVGIFSPVSRGLPLRCDYNSSLMFIPVFFNIRVSIGSVLSMFSSYFFLFPSFPFNLLYFSGSNPCYGSIFSSRDSVGAQDFHSNCELHFYTHIK